MKQFESFASKVDGDVKAGGGPIQSKDETGEITAKEHKKKRAKKRIKTIAAKLRLKSKSWVIS